MKIKTACFTIALLIFGGQLYAQELTRDSVIGSWKVITSQLLPDPAMKLNAEGAKKMEEFRKGMLDTKFNFGSNSKFTLEFPATTSPFMKELNFLNNKNWIIKGKDIIQIGPEENLMKIIVRAQENKIYFLLDESPFLLEVVRL